MKAKVQYNDFIGTVAADISDYTDLNKFIKDKGADTERFYAIGASYYSSYNGEPNISIICKDRDKNNELINLRFENISKEDFFNLFKRLDVVISEHGYENLEIVEDIEL